MYTYMKVKVKPLIRVQFFATPMDCSLTGSSVHGIFQARVLEWGAISFSRDLPNSGIKLRSPTLQADALPSEPPRKPDVYIIYIYNNSIIFIKMWNPTLIKNNCTLIYLVYPDFNYKICLKLDAPISQPREWHTFGKSLRWIIMQI